MKPYTGTKLKRVSVYYANLISIPRRTGLSALLLVTFTLSFDDGNTDLRIESTVLLKSWVAVP